jgi:ABC-type sugar transport system ATPase subunit
VKRYINELKIKTSSIHTQVNTLSGGNQQKVLLSRCLVHKPSILLLDEPTRGVDVGAKVEIYQIIYRLAKQGVGIVFVSSELPEVLGLSDRILIMREGQIKKEFKKEEATQEKIMSVATSLPGQK